MINSYIHVDGVHLDEILELLDKRFWHDKYVNVQVRKEPGERGYRVTLSKPQRIYLSELVEQAAYAERFGLIDD